MSEIKEFSELNGYGVKDAVARAEIEQLKENYGGKLYEHQLSIEMYSNEGNLDNSLGYYTLNANIVSSEKSAFTLDNFSKKITGHIVLVIRRGSSREVIDNVIGVVTETCDFSLCGELELNPANTDMGDYFLGFGSDTQEFAVVQDIVKEI